MFFVHETLRTMLEVIEEKMDSSLGRMTYSVVIIVHFFQLMGYIDQTPDSILINEDMIDKLMLVFYNSTFFYILNWTDTIELTIFFFYLLVSLIALSYLYVIGVTILRLLKPRLYKSMGSLLQPVNRLANVCLVYFSWVVIFPILELTFGMFYCSGNTYIVTYRDNCENYPTLWIVVSSTGYLLAIIMGLLVIFFYRNYEFNEKQILKR